MQVQIRSLFWTVYIILSLIYRDRGDDIALSLRESMQAREHPEEAEQAEQAEATAAPVAETTAAPAAPAELN